MIGRALMLRYYLLASGREDAGNIPFDRRKILLNILPVFSLKVIMNFLSGLRHLPLWNITEMTIGFFGIGNYSSMWHF